MDKNLIKKYLNNTFISESDVPGISVTNKNKKESGKFNKEAIKDINKKVGNFEKAVKSDPNSKEMGPNKYNYDTDFQKTYHDEMEIMNGQEMIQYDREPNEKFTERSLEAIEGSSRMGNNPEWANVIPKQMGFTGPEFGKNLVKKIKSSIKKRGLETPAISLRGKDIQELPTEMVDNGHKPYAINESKGKKNEYKGYNIDKIEGSGMFRTKSKDVGYLRADTMDGLKKLINKEIETKETKKLNEGLTEKGIEIIKKKVAENGERPTAIWFVDYYLNKMIGLSASDLSDTAIYANGLDEIEEALADEDFNGAAALAKETAHSMLEDEGHDFGLDENKNNAHINEANNNTKTKQGMKRLKFKNPFNGVGNALKLIPESYRVNNKLFEMTDGIENYKIRWEGSLTEGKAVVLMASDKTLVNEDIQKMKHLMGFKSENTLGLLKGKQRLNENTMFTDIWNKTKNIVTETEDMEGANAKEGNWDEETKKSKESTKHVKGSVKKDSMIAKGKEGNPDKAVSHAPEAKKPMKSSSGKNIESQEKPSEGYWEDAAKSQAPEAKKHVHLKENMYGEEMHGMEESMYEEMDEKMLENMLKKIQMEEEGMHHGMEHETMHHGMEEEGMYENEIVYEIEMEDDEEENTFKKKSLDFDKTELSSEIETDEEGEEPADDSNWSKSDENDYDDMEKEPSMSDMQKMGIDPTEFKKSEDIKLLTSPKTGEYYIKKNDELIKVPNEYLSIASNKSLPGYKRAAKIYYRIENDLENRDELEEI